jgi:bifunctional DNA-binding transcriptional regulator/antitoxin component of YhaV-PrlF toxin-antitoxin module
MNYTYSITSKGQITIPKAFREKLGLDKLGKATLRVNDRNEIVITVPKDLAEVRSLLNKPTFKDKISRREQAIGTQLAKKYAVD